MVTSLVSPRNDGPHGNCRKRQGKSLVRPYRSGPTVHLDWACRAGKNFLVPGIKVHRVIASPQIVRLSHAAGGHDAGHVSSEHSP